MTPYLPQIRIVVMQQVAFVPVDSLPRIHLPLLLPSTSGEEMVLDGRIRGNLAEGTLTADTVLGLQYQCKKLRYCTLRRVVFRIRNI